MTPQSRNPQPRCHRSNIRRTRTGCASCKLRRKKCDERKPICRGCERNSLKCTWPYCGQTPKIDDSKRLVSDESRQEGVPSQVPTIVEQSTAVVNTARSSDLSTNTTTDVLYRTANMKVMPTSIALRFSSADSAFSTPSSRTLLQYFTKETANTLCSRTGTRNPFITELLPIAMSNSLVLHAVLTLAGVHYADRVSTSLDPTTWYHYSQAIQGVNREISTLGTGDLGKEVLPLLLTTLVLCFIEVRPPM